MLFSLTACSKNYSEDSFEEFLKEFELLDIYNGGICTSVTDAVKYPNPWTIDIERVFVISDETIRSMSTCGLFVTLIEDPSDQTWKPWCSYCSTDIPGVTIFNNRLKANKVAIELFERDDYYPVLASKYLTVLKFKEVHQDGSIINMPLNISYLEMLLASDMCISTLREKEQIQLLAMALERTKYTDVLKHITYHIMIAIMDLYNYAPFVEDIKPRLFETTFGYSLLNLQDDEPYNFTLSMPQADIIKEYATQFLNEQKLLHYEIN